VNSFSGVELVVERIAKRLVTDCSIWNTFLPTMGLDTSIVGSAEFLTFQILAAVLQ
jgi:hypothetical protein